MGGPDAELLRGDGIWRQDRLLWRQEEAADARSRQDLPVLLQRAQAAFVARFHEFMHEGGRGREGDAEGAPLFLIGKDSCGHWVARDQAGLCGGLFVGRSEAIRFAMHENGCPSWAVIMVPGVLELMDNLPLKNAA
jgi:hypothetical protein